MISTSKKSKLGTLSTLSIGIGGMVGGGIFAVTGLTVDVTKGAAPIAFLIAGIVALLTSFSYLKLTLKFPGEGGTVEFLNRAFGSGRVTGAANILLLVSYIVLVAIYAYAFGSYGAGFFPEQDREFWLHFLISAAIVGLVIINIFSTNLVIRSENFFNVVKMLLLLTFIVGGFLTPVDWDRLGSQNFVTPLSLIAGAMLIFLNYEGFELIANASKDVANPKRSLPFAYIGGVLTVIVLYMLITVVVVGHLSFNEISKVSDHVLSVAAQYSMGYIGFIAIVIAALMATSSAINATFYGTGRLAYSVARSGELPKDLEKTMHGQHFEGTLITALLALIIANFVPLEAIATMGSAGFLLIFFAVNIANVRLAKETGGGAWVSVIAALSTAFALVIMCIKVDENPATRYHLWILLGMILISFLIEIIYRKFTGRKLNLLKTKNSSSSDQKDSATEAVQ